jgi:hypothetical protein
MQAVIMERKSQYLASPCVPLTEDHARRGGDPQQAAMFSSLSPEERVP